MIRTPEWSPDTCGCTVKYKWDTDKHEVVELMGMQSAFAVDDIVACKEHQEGTNAEKYERIVAKNKYKNNASTELLKVLELPDDVEVPWGYKGDELTLQSPSKEKLADVKTALAEKGFDVTLE